MNTFWNGVLPAITTPFNADGGEITRSLRATSQ